MRTTTKLLLLVGSAVATVVPAMPAHAATADAEISNFSFSPAPAIHVGDPLRWTNKDGTSHTITADDGSFSSPSIASQGMFAHTFNDPGTVAYHCAIHPSMKGSVTVEAVPTTAAPTTTTAIAGGSPSPTTAGSAVPKPISPKATAPKPAVSPTTVATGPTTTTAPAAAADPYDSATTAPALLPEAAAPSTQPVLDTASENYGSGSGAGLGLAVGALVILGGGAGAGWWVLRRRRTPA